MTTKELSEQEIKRYILKGNGKEFYEENEMFEDKWFGDWVMYEDHESTVTALRAEIEWLKKQQQPAQIDDRSNLKTRIGNVLYNVVQIIDVEKSEWQQDQTWTEWDQSVRDEILEVLKLLAKPPAQLQIEERVEFAYKFAEFEDWRFELDDFGNYVDAEMWARWQGWQARAQLEKDKRK